MPGFIVPSTLIFNQNNKNDLGNRSNEIPQINMTTDERLAQIEISIAAHIKEDALFQEKISDHMSEEKVDRKEMMNILKGDGIYSTGIADDVKQIKSAYTIGKTAVVLVTIGLALISIIEFIKSMSK